MIILNWCFLSWLLALLNVDLKVENIFIYLDYDYCLWWLLLERELSNWGGMGRKVIFHCIYFGSFKKFIPYAVYLFRE